jgi:hypothetical protein
MDEPLKFDETLLSKDLTGLMEVNANIEVVLTRKDQSRVIVNLGMFHGGPSSARGRTKTETLTLVNQQDSFGASRVDKFLLNGVKQPEPGITSSSSGLSVELCPTEGSNAKDKLENARPALNFLNTLLYADDLKNINDQVKSPLVSHTIGIKLMAAALKSGYSGQSVSFPIRDPEWQQVGHVLEVGDQAMNGVDAAGAGAGKEGEVKMDGGIDIRSIGVMRQSGGMKVKFHDEAVDNVLKSGFNGFSPDILNITLIENPLIGQVDPGLEALSEAPPN